MFVQVIQGHVSDAAQVRAQLDSWVQEVAPGAVGWLGSTSGVTDDGMLIALARFESGEAARQNSDRPEQTGWWEQTAALFTGEPVFHNSTSVDVDAPGDPSQAGFVQVMQGRSSDPDRARELMANDPTDWRGFRPDILVTDLDFGVDDLEGAALIRRALGVQPDLKVIVLTMHKDSSTMAEAMAAGAAAYVVKTVTPDLSHGPATLTIYEGQSGSNN